MINAQYKTLSIALVLISAVGLSACSTIGKVKEFVNDRGSLDYQKNQSVKQLEIPPDLTTPEFDKAFELPKGVISAVSLNNGGTGALVTSSTAANNSNVGAVRSGDLSTIRTIGGRSVLQVNDTYPRAKILTEIMLTRMGFSTLSKSSAGDSITAKYGGPTVTSDGKRQGFFSKAKGLVGLGSDNTALKSGENYRVTIRNEQNTPIVRVERADAKSISNAGNTKIISLLNNAFNR